jgi:hypothetical protein
MPEPRSRAVTEIVAVEAPAHARGRYSYRVEVTEAARVIRIRFDSDQVATDGKCGGFVERVAAEPAGDSNRGPSTSTSRSCAAQGP